MPLPISLIEIDKTRDPAQPVKFADLVHEKSELQLHFIRMLPNGRVPDLEPKKKEPEISPEEVQRRRLEILERETYQKAFAAGEKAGLAMGEQKAKVVLTRMANLIGGLDGLPGRIFASSESFLIETAIVLVRSLLRHELSVNRDSLATRVRELLRQAAGRNQVVIHVAPADMEFLSRLPEFEEITFEPDPKVEQGSLVLHSDFGGIEENHAEQLQLVEEALRDFLHDRLEELSARQPEPPLVMDPVPGALPPAVPPAAPVPAAPAAARRRG